jgi:predicted permease
MELWKDVRFALRMLLKNPGWSAIIVVALALGLGVNTAVFGIVNIFLMRPLPVAHPETLAWVTDGPASEARVWDPLSFPDYQRLRQETELFEGLVATVDDSWVFNTGVAAKPRDGENIDLSFGEYLSGDAFAVLGVKAALGRTFTLDDDRPDAPPVIVLSDTIWRRQLGADPNVIGRKVYLNAGARTVIGVMPPSFHLMSPLQLPLQYWVPMGQRVPLSGVDTGWTADRQNRELRVLVRLRPGVTLAAAQARLAVLGATLARDFPASNAGIKLNITSEIEGRYGDSHEGMRRSCVLALLVAGLVLVICCANVASLLLARASRRTRELGIRLALGAGRARIARQLLTESLVLAILGGALGLVVAYWFGDLLMAVLPPVPYFTAITFQPDGLTMAWAVGATVLAGLGFGAFPAWRASRGSLMTMVKTDLRTEGHRLTRPGLRQALVVAQVAVSIVVVVSGGLFLRSLKKQEAIDPGYRTENLVSGLVNPSLFTDDMDKVRAFFRELTRRLEQQAGVSAVSSSLYMPLVNVQGGAGPIIRDGDGPPPPNQSKPVNYNVVSANYFQTMGTRLLFGRDFTEADRQGAPRAAILNAHMARTLYGREDAAVGKRFRIGGLDAPVLEIVGVAQDGHYFSLREASLPWIFFPTLPAETHDTQDGMRTFIVRARSARDVPAVAAGLRAAVQSLDPRVPVSELMTDHGHLAFALYLQRLVVGLGSILAALALLLATMGIYSVMTYTVSQRTREIGIRMALGGRVGDVLGLVLGQGLGLTLFGVGLGALGAWALTRFFASALYGISATDPLTFLGSTALLVGVALLATLLPARRAAKVDPMVALRYE